MDSHGSWLSYSPSICETNDTKAYFYGMTKKKKKILLKIDMDKLHEPFLGNYNNNHYYYYYDDDEDWNYSSHKFLQVSDKKRKHTKTLDYIKLHGGILFKFTEVKLKSVTGWLKAMSSIPALGSTFLFYFPFKPLKYRIRHFCNRLLFYWKDAEWVFIVTGRDWIGSWVNNSASCLISETFSRRLGRRTCMYLSVGGFKRRKMLS